MAEPKDVYTLNEAEALSRLLQNVNDFLIENEGDDMEMTTCAITVRDRRGVLVGSFTKWSKNEDIKFEPNFDAGSMGV